VLVQFLADIYRCVSVCVHIHISDIIYDNLSSLLRQFFSLVSVSFKFENPNSHRDCQKRLYSVVPLSDTLGCSDST
jgi:ABC-type uncharacterized transport system ATPase subunit